MTLVECVVALAILGVLFSVLGTQAVSQQGQTLQSFCELKAGRLALRRLERLRAGAVELELGEQDFEIPQHMRGRLPELRAVQRVDDLGAGLCAVTLRLSWRHLGARRQVELHSMLRRRRGR